MRTIVKLAYAAGALMTAGCSGADGAMNDDLKKDLEMAWSSDAITLAGTDQSAGRQVVSAIERDAVPAPRRVAPSAPCSEASSSASHTCTGGGCRGRYGRGSRGYG